MTDKYCFNIPEGGSKSLDILDYLFNNTTQTRLVNSGLNKGIHFPNYCASAAAKNFCGLIF